ncbi:hypothetical protein [Streptomyces sp. NPDC004528]|uniref:hypothetical protein n=1 Tax=Streptomyces sp. NPDC004528 TaxID=3154550 RepID=UPI0033BB1429
MTEVLSKKNSLLWAGKQAAAKRPWDWSDELEWVLANEDRFRGIGPDRRHAVIDAARCGDLQLNLRECLDVHGAIDWDVILDNIRHGCMSEFIETPHGVLFMDCG